MALRVAQHWTRPDLADTAGVSISTVERMENGASVSIGSAESIAAALNTVVEAFAAVVPVRGPTSPSSGTHLSCAFTLRPNLLDGANWRPDPDSISESEGYCFQFHGELNTSIECCVATIRLEVERDGKRPMCTGSGKSSFYHGALRDVTPHSPLDEPSYGFVTIDGRRNYLDQNYRFKKMLALSPDRPHILHISRWCRAPSGSDDRRQTGSLWFWLSEPLQIIEIEYTLKSGKYLETHEFSFEGNDMIFERASVREVK